MVPQLIVSTCKSAMQALVRLRLAWVPPNAVPPGELAPPLSTVTAVPAVPAKRVCVKLSCAGANKMNTEGFVTRSADKGDVAEIAALTLNPKLTGADVESSVAVRTSKADLNIFHEGRYFGVSACIQSTVGDPAAGPFGRKYTPSLSFKYICVPRPIWRRLLKSCVALPRSCIPPMAGKRSAASTAMMAITTSISIRVKAREIFFSMSVGLKAIDFVEVTEAKMKQPKQGRLDKAASGPLY